MTDPPVPNYTRFIRTPGLTAMTHTIRVRLLLPPLLPPLVRLLGGLMAAIFLDGIVRADDAAPPATHLHTQRIDATWTGVPLREIAGRLSTMSGLAVVVDRRIDPDARVSLTASDEPLPEVLATLAKEARAEVVLLASHARLTPSGSAARLRAAERTRVAEIRRLSAADKARATARSAWTWPAGATPRELMTAAAAAAGIALTDLDTLPHDHFPAAALPPLPLAERLDLLLAHFDRRVEWKNVGHAADGRPTFAIVSLAGVQVDAADRLPGSKDRAGVWPPTPPGKKAAAGATYSLKVAAPLDALLATLATRLGLTLDVDRASLQARGIAGGEIIRLDVANVSRDELLDAVLDPLALDWQIENQTLRVRGR